MSWDSVNPLNKSTVDKKSVNFGSFLDLNTSPQKFNIFTLKLLMCAEHANFAAFYLNKARLHFALEQLIHDEQLS